MRSVGFIVPLLIEGATGSVMGRHAERRRRM
jgi:hypothetical protein